MKKGEEGRWGYHMKENNSDNKIKLESKQNARKQLMLLLYSTMVNDQ